MRLRIAFGIPVLEDRVASIDLVARLLLCMADTLRWSLEDSRPDSGAYNPLTWVKDVLRCYEATRDSDPRLYSEPVDAIPLTGHWKLRPTFLLILRLFEACLHHRLLTGETTAADFEQLLRFLRYPELPPVPEDLTLNALAARGVSGPFATATQDQGGPQVSRDHLERVMMLTRHM